jgi:hypothetical protein
VPDEILNDMAGELRDALVRNGLDPKKPPATGKPPPTLAFKEYRRRGGSQQDNADEFLKALIKQTGKVA